MCGRYTLLLSWIELHKYLAGFIAGLKFQNSPEINHAPARYNIAPTQPMLVLQRAGGSVEPCLMRWGLVPEWVEDPNDFPLIINARAETLAEKTSFKNALKNRRCIVPVSGYYEWQKNADGSKTPVYITRKDKTPFLMAGLYSTWVGPDGEEVDTAAIITVAASAELKEIHHRTPAILNKKSSGQWLDTASVNAVQAHELLQSLPEDMAEFHPVSTRVNSPLNDSKDLIVPVFDSPSSPRKTTKSPAPKKPAQLNLF